MQSFHAVLDEIDQISTALFNADGHLDYPLDKLPGLQKELLYALQFHMRIAIVFLKLFIHLILMAKKNL
jgi:hypothetical protein